MDWNQFDDLSRRLAAGISRRTAVKGAAAGLLGALGLRKAAEAQVTQAQCGNRVCAANPGVCSASGCVCCVYGNGNSRCRPPGLCAPGTEVGGTTTTTTTTTAAPTTTTTTTSRCSSGMVQCGASCCADCFAERDETGAVTPICCPSSSVCAGATGAAGDDQCCWFDEVCLAPNTPCCRSDGIGGCAVDPDCAGCCRACGTDGSGNRVCCDETEECVTDSQTGQQACEFLNTARLSRSRL